MRSSYTYLPASFAMALHSSRTTCVRTIIILLSSSPCRVQTLHCSHFLFLCHLLSIRLGIRCLSCSITFWSSQTCCFLSAHMHSCYLCTLTTHTDRHMFHCFFLISHFTSLQVLTFCPICLSTLHLLHTFPICTSLLLSTNVYYALSLYFFTHVYSLFFTHSSPLACSFSHALLLSYAHSLPTSTLCAIVIHSTLITSSSPVTSASWWLLRHTPYSGHVILLLMVQPALCIF